ncbi:MAG: hypothetical protein ACRD0Z_16110 [Acidimicrobiales bacterium]
MTDLTPTEPVSDSWRPMSTGEALAVVIGRGRRRRHRRIAVAGAAPILLTACVVLGLVVSAPAPKGTNVRPLSSGAAAHVVYGLSDGPGAFGFVGAAGDGVWFFPNDVKATIYFVQPGHSRSYHLPGDVKDDGSPVLATAPGDVVWAAAGQVLFRLDGQTGQLQSVDLPAPGDTVDPSRGAVSDALSDRPDSLAAGGPSGQVVIGFFENGAIETYNPASGHISRIRLPSGYFPNDVAILPDGTIGVAMQRPDPHPAFAVYVIGRNAASMVPVKSDDQGIVDYEGHGFLVGETQPVLVSEAGRVVPLSVGFDLPAAWHWDSWEGAPVRSGVVAGGGVVRSAGVPGKSSYLVVASPNARSNVYPMPEEHWPEEVSSCPGGGCRPVPAHEAMAPISDIAVDGAGDIWVLTETPRDGTAFAEVPAIG